VLVTTHSPELLGCFDLNQVAVMTREDGRAKWYRPASRESLRQMLEAVGGDTLADLHRSGELEAMP
jgi:predicted ATP-dependent endonuclease of OLD family